MKFAAISISTGNSKVGHIPSISLPPGVTCTPDARRSCYLSGCYASKLARIYPNVRRSWDANLAVYREAPEVYFRHIDAYLSDYKPRFFRWHISGDIPDNRYFYGMVRLATAHPEIRFLAFTKTVHRTTAANLQIIRSAWPGMPLVRRYSRATAWVRDSRNPDHRIPNSARECPGNCESCGMCWALDGSKGESVVFDKH